jgi:hypothetical protein
MLGLTFVSSDMIDNTTLTLGISGMGVLHKEQRSIHTISTTLNAKIGDTIGLMIGYDYKMGKPEEAYMSPWSPDRDAVTGTVTYYFM